MHAARGAIVALRAPANAAIIAAGAVHGFNDAQHRDLRGRLAEVESAAGAFARFEKAVARQLLEKLGEEVRGDAR